MGVRKKEGFPGKERVYDGLPWKESKSDELKGRGNEKETRTGYQHEALRHDLRRAER